jgi:hypothetical protein
VLTNTALSVSAARGGAAFLGSGCPWAPTMSGAGLSHVQTLIPGSAIVPTARVAAFAPARRTPAIERPLGVKVELPLLDNRKQYVHMTRVNAGGDGASGPHPEREPGLN